MKNKIETALGRNIILLLFINKLYNTVIVHKTF